MHGPIDSLYLRYLLHFNLLGSSMCDVGVSHMRFPNFQFLSLAFRLWSNAEGSMGVPKV